MKRDSANNYFPIRVLSEMTGVAASTLRAWERRYGLLVPKRTPKGHRLYTLDDVRLVSRVVELLKDGHTVGEVARRLAGPAPQAAARQSFVAGGLNLGGVWDGYLQTLLQAVEAFSPQRLEAIYNEASSLYPLDLVSQRLVEPALQILGERWGERATGIAEEHFFSAWLRNKLGARLHHASNRADGSTLLCACVPGHLHETGLLLFALAALGRGYRIVYLGPDMPLQHLPAVAACCAARGIVLAGGREEHPAATTSSMAKLAQESDCPVFVGGPLAELHADELNAVAVIPIGEQLSLALHLVETKVPVHSSRK